MKNTIFALLAATAFIFYSQMGFAQSWGDWSSISCWKGIEIRTKKVKMDYTPGKVKWFVEIQNNYKKDIGIEVGIAPYPSTPNDFDNKFVSAGESSVAWFIISDCDRISIRTRSLRWNNSYREEDKYSCDK